MDFARKQLEKYGWTDGKGLGRHENGISEALKPKLKRSSAGIGHDPASDFNEHWWTALYDKAAGNVEVEERNGKTKKIKTKEKFQITNSTWKLKRKHNNDENEQGYSEFFVRTAVLTNGGSKIENVRESESDIEEEKRDVFKMTDEELFSACGGRTAHKGARHGLKASGKLARIAQQEALLLTQSRFKGYSHAKALTDKVVEEINLSSDSEVNQIKKKKKKRKRCYSNEKPPVISDVAELNSSHFPDNANVTEDHSMANITKKKTGSKKSKYSKNKNSSNIEVIPEEDETVKIFKKKSTCGDLKLIEVNNTEIENNNEYEVKHKKKKKT